MASSSDKKWRSGFPEHPGWYNASRSANTHTWRWFDGKQWCDYCSDEYDAEEAGRIAANPAYETDDPSRQIKYRTFYPKNARVPIHEARDFGNVVSLPKAKLKVRA